MVHEYLSAIAFFNMNNLVRVSAILIYYLSNKHNYQNRILQNYFRDFVVSHLYDDFSLSLMGSLKIVHPVFNSNGRAINSC